MNLQINNLDDFYSGQIIAMDKPITWTSFDVVKKIKSLIEKKIRLTENIPKIKRLKVGHAGTLDPLAEGLVILCTGKATKQILSIQEGKKEYIANIGLGHTTPSYDLETEYDEEFPTDHITKEKVLEILNTFIGEQDQIPPIFSAKNIKGRRAYDYARKGEEVVMTPKRISISEIELLDYQLPAIKIRVVCGKGTYIRSLAYDIGKKLNSGGHLTKLIRTQIGKYSLNNSFKIGEFENFLGTL
ncbi:MAG: tRNA pseudouridine(55) synthase TruB [Bacteroidales bacterium]|jgi:tRNA pseudouridine55 synthase|nr:tRNA pseudouridine(55) synthase TruB [Bacteroidales bacterium]